MKAAYFVRNLVRLPAMCRLMKVGHPRSTGAFLLKPALSAKPAARRSENARCKASPHATRGIWSFRHWAALSPGVDRGLCFSVDRMTYRSLARRMGCGDALTLELTGLLVSA